MKKVFIVILFSLALQSAQAQILQLQDPVSSKNFNSEKYTGIRGTPFLQEKWNRGIVITNNGVYNDLELKIDLFDSKVYFNKNDESFELLDQIIGLKLYPKWPDTSAALSFMRGINQNSIKPEQYVQILVGSGTVQFYRSDIKQLTEMSEINAGMVKTFANTSRYYIKKGDQYKLIKLAKEEVLPFLQDKEAAVNSLITDQKLNLKKESDIVKLLQGYNSL